LSAPTRSSPGGRDAQRIYVSKAPGSHVLNQDAINAIPS
jgi:hypothetical protein